MGALDELLSSWRANPDAESTVALATYLGVSGREELIREVGGRAETWHATDCDVMLAVGRMYLDGGLLSEAQATLVTAGKADAQDGRPFRYLGEVLLRRGDAMRAEKVLARAVQLGQGDAETRLWHDRAVVYVALQKRVGPQAVATEVSRTLPKQLSIPPPTMATTGSYTGEEEPTNPRADQPIALGGPTPAMTSAVQAHAVQRGDGASRRPKPPALPRPPQPPLPSFDMQEPRAAPGQVSMLLAQAMPPARSTEPQVPWVPSANVPYQAQASAIPPLSPPTPLGGLAAPMPLPRGGAPYAPQSAMGATRPWQPAAAAEVRYEDLPNPAPELVLEHLARAGIYEPSGGAPPAWERPVFAKTRGTWVLLLATILLIGAGAGAYKYAQYVRQQRNEQARVIGDEVEKLLHAGGIEELRATDQRLSTAFDLDSRSHRSAKHWLQNRVLSALLLPGEQTGIDSAVHRALSLGIPEEEVAYGRITAFLAEGDIAGAAALLPKWDGKAPAKDAFYQLASGAALERAGDVRAVERYEAARAIDPKLIAADILLARLALLELGPAKGRPVIDALRKKVGDRPDVKALSALAWAVDAERSERLPSDADMSAQDHEKLPAPLKAVPFMVEAVLAMNAADYKKASQAIASAVTQSTTPALATRLGFLAIQAGDEQLARRAALRALQFAAVYPGARILAARVALLGGRLDEAKKAVEELDPRSADILVVRAVAAYETLDSTELSSALEGLGDQAKRDDFAALAAAGGVLQGRGYPDAASIDKMSDPSVPWGELVAIDAALDLGDLALAQKLAGNWGDTERPVYLIRLARLRRAQGKTEEADKASRVALENGTTTARVLIERVYDLVAREDVKGAREIAAKYPTLIGPMTAWLSALVDAASNHKAEANVKVAQLDLPPDAAPLLLRVLVARALAAAGDKRARPYIRGFSRSAARNPDVVQASLDSK